MYFEHCTPSSSVSKVEMFREEKITLAYAKVILNCLFLILALVFLTFHAFHFHQRFSK